MVSNRCKIAVKQELQKLGLHFIIVELGEVEIIEDLDFLNLFSESELKESKLLKINTNTIKAHCKGGNKVKTVKIIFIDLVNFSDFQTNEVDAIVNPTIIPTNILLSIFYFFPTLFTKPYFFSVYLFHRSTSTCHHTVFIICTMF
jgi:hypothetical protein